MSKLNQVIAVQSTKKTHARTTLTQTHHILQKPELFSGLVRRYTPVDEAGEKHPDEEALPKANAREIIEQAKAVLVEMYDVVATQDWGNRLACADVVVGGVTVIEKAPVTYLLFLEKQLIDVHTFVNKLVTQESGFEWRQDEQTGIAKSTPYRTTKTKKVLRSFVKAEATDKFPAQVETFNEDVIIGYYENTKYSSAVTPGQKAHMLERVRLLLDAVKSAREEANSISVENHAVGKPIVDFIFG